MRKKVRKSLAFLLALALVVSVMSGLGLSVSADDAQNEPVAAAADGEQTTPVEETPKAEESTPKEGKKEEEADPAAEAVQEEKKDEQKAEGEGSGDNEKVANDQSGEQKQEEPKAEPAAEAQDEPKAEPAAEEQDEPEEDKNLLAVQANDAEVSEYTISCDDKKLTVKLVDESGKAVKGIAPKNLTIEKNTRESVDDYAADVKEYTYSSAYYYDGNQKRNVSEIVYYDNYGSGRDIYNGWYSVDGYYYITRSKITNDTLYLEYTQNSKFNANFKVHYVDENGIEIGEKTKSISVDDVRSIVFSDYADPIAGYTYWRACYSSANNAEVTKMVREKQTDLWSTEYVYRFYNGTTKLTAGTESISELTDIYLVYVKNGGGPGTGGGTTGGGGELQAPSHEKMAVKNAADGTYDLSLSVSGSVGNSTQKAMVDIIYVLDTSGSMTKSKMEVNGQSVTLLNAAKNAINVMSSGLTAQDSLIDARFALVTFAEESSITSFNNSEWTGSSTTLYSKLPNNADGGTNYEAGLKNAKTLLNTTRQNATTVVIFLSDGVPTFYVDGGTGSSDNDGRAMSKARGIVKQMTPNYLFTVGVGKPKNYNNLYLVTDAAHSGVQAQNYVGDNDENLRKAFDNMKGKITSIACQNVTISDKLSANVAMVLENDKPKKLVGKVTDKDGNPVVTPSSDGKIALPKTNLNAAVTLDAPTYDGATKTFEWKFPDDYKLEANYTYTVTANVDVTEIAFEHYRKDNKYPDTADAGTGTHGSKGGLFSNDNENAKLIYTVTGESNPKEVKYQKPVVQLTPSKLTIKKTVNGLDETALEKLKNSLKFKVTYTYANKSTKEEKISFNDFDLQSDGTYSYTSDTLDCWSMDATYTVEEKDFAVEGYDCTNSGTTVTGKIEGRNRDETASFTNNYQHKNVTVTIKKEVTGNMSQTSDKFTFSVTNPSNLADGDKSFELSADNTDGKAISIPYGSDFTITETPSNGYTLVRVNDTAVTDTTYELKNVTTDTTITFTNEKQITPPNGIITTIAPYAIMVVLAAGAGVYFVYSRRRRNR